MLVPRTVFQLHNVADNEYRHTPYAICGINFHRSSDGGPIAVATDGDCLMAAKWIEDPPEEYPIIKGCDLSPNREFQALIPSKVCKKAPMLAKDAIRSRKAIIARNVVIDEHLTVSRSNKEDRRVSIGATDLESEETLNVAVMEGRFPPYEEMFPSTTEAITVKITVEILEKVLTTYRKMGIETVTMAITDHETAIIISGESDDGITVASAIMPRVSKDEVGIKPEIGWVPTKSKK